MPNKIVKDHTQKIHNPSKYSLDKDSNMVNKGLIPLGGKVIFNYNSKLTSHFILFDFLSVFIVTK